MSIEKFVNTFSKSENPPFSMFSNHVVQNIHDGITLAVWVYLSSMPIDWKINRAQLMKHFNIGEKKINNIMRDLNKMNLLEYSIEKDQKGKFTGNTAKILCGTKFNHIPETAPAKTVGAETVGAETGATENAVHTNKDIYKKNNYKINNLHSFDENEKMDNFDQKLNNKDFDLFWEQYPKKVNKRAALKIFCKGNFCTSDVIADIAWRKSNDPQWKDFQYIPYPSSYLNGRRWEDEKAPIASVQKKSEDGKSSANGFWDWALEKNKPNGRLIDGN